MQKKLSTLLLFSCISSGIFAQLNTTQFGFSFKPIFPSKYLRTGPKEFSDKNINYKLSQNSGYSAGVLIRRGITKKLSGETGILYVKRNFDLALNDSSYTDNGSFSIIGYEIPVSALVFIQLDEKLWMSTALGASIDIFPSDILTYKADYLHYASRNTKVNAGVLANIGLEYRTAKSGTIYFGTSYHRSVNSIYNTLIEYYPTRNYNDPYTSSGKTKLQGDYFTFDVRYYFHEDPEKKKKKRKK